jgi:glycosyltransferase involved in cell wall biosynthesis
MDCRPMVVLLGHYRPVEGRSMAGYRQLVEQGLRQRGYWVKSITAPRLLSRLVSTESRATKWLGYLDQLLIFPPLLLLRQLVWPEKTSIVVLDQALGPWVPWIQHRNPLIICHDLLALRASRGDFAEHRVGRSGQLYQQLILWGFRHGQRFAAVSAASAADLRRELKQEAKAWVSVIYNPLPNGFYPMTKPLAHQHLKKVDVDLKHSDFILHVGGYWYKNREGVCAVFAALHQSRPDLKLVLVGHLEEPAQAVLQAHPDIQNSILHLPGVTTEELRALYSSAAALLFPSWLEGFGWPVLEALACGCPVITTDRDPMREVGGHAAVYIPACPSQREARDHWVKTTAQTALTVLNRSVEQQTHWRKRSLEQAARFSHADWLDQLEQAIRQPA